ncbi:hypothetical protein [Kutzneria sp. NPDC052558]|uniref:hypothetical protein n=1 Tax=Kutzneria sp. NPDC052558 TaxID=3364121 RepID=UPI0037CA60B1
MPSPYEDSDTIAFRHGRWLLVAQGIVFVLAGGWALVTDLVGGGLAAVAGVALPAALAGIVAGTGLVSLLCAARVRAAKTLVCVQAPVFLILFMVSAATRKSGQWQSVFGYDATASLVYLVIGLIGLVLVMWLFRRALGERGDPGHALRRR